MTESPLRAELLRLQTLEQHELLEMEADPGLDDIVRLAANLADTPAAALTLLSKDAVLLPASYGIDISEAPRYVLPCEFTLSGDGVYQIPDARHDADFAPDGISLGEQRFRFYAGAPIVMPSGVAIGCVCVFDVVARALSPAQLQSLEMLSRLVVTRFELSARARHMDRSERVRRRIEGALTVERNFVSAVLDTVGAMVVVLDTEGRIVRFNRACEQISGYASADLVGKYAWQHLIPSEDLTEYGLNFDRIRSGQCPARYENIWVVADGLRRRIAWSATTLLDSVKQVSFIIATGIDVTVQRVAETAIRESEARYRQLVEGALGMVFTHDLEGRILSINAHGAEGIGRRVDQVVGHPLTDFIFAERQALFAPYLETLRQNGEAQGLLPLSHTNGDERVVAYRNRLIEEPGRPAYVLAFGVDITEQVRAEEKLRALIRQSNSVLESVGDGIYGLDLEGRLTVLNPAAEQMLGYRAEEVLGMKGHDLIRHTRADGSPYNPQDCPIQRSLANLETIRVSKEVFWRKDGTSFPVEYVARPQIETVRAPFASPLESSSGLLRPARSEGTDLLPAAGIESESPASRAVGVVVAFTDISERNALDRMKDEFISTVSHELRTPLTSLRAALGLVSGGALLQRPEKVQHMMNIAIDNTDRLVRLVNDILELESIGSGKSQMRSSRCSMEDLFRSAVKQFDEAAVRNNLRFTIEANDVHVWADPERVLQTLTNLIANAIKFSREHDSKGNEVRLLARIANGGEALVEVRDQGCGIPSDKLEVIFERFKQIDASDTRAMGGTGLGLAICRSIIAQHGGRIWATSEVGKGSIFHFTLPTRPSSNLR